MRTCACISESNIEKGEPQGERSMRESFYRRVKKERKKKDPPIYHVPVFTTAAGYDDSCVRLENDVVVTWVAEAVS